MTVAQNVKMPAGLVYFTFSDLFRVFHWQTVAFCCILLSTIVRFIAAVYYFQRH